MVVCALLNLMFLMRRVVVGADIIHVMRSTSLTVFFIVCEMVGRAFVVYVRRRTEHTVTTTLLRAIVRIDITVSKSICILVSIITVAIIASIASWLTTGAVVTTSGFLIVVIRWNILVHD